MESRRYNTAGRIGAEKAAVQTGAEGMFKTSFFSSYNLT